MVPDLPDSMSESTEDCSPNDNIFAIFPKPGADLRSLGPSGPAVSTDLEIIVISPSIFHVKYLSSSASNDEQNNLDSTSTIKASDNDPTFEVLPTVRLQLIANNSNEDQHEPPHAYSFPTNSSPVLSHPNQFKHTAETANWVNSHQHRREHFTSKPTAIIRPRINSRLRHRLKPESESWELIFRENQRKELTIQNTSLLSQRLLVPVQAVTVLPH